jgi:hypothetical protein
MATARTRYSLPSSAGGLARRATLGIGVAVLAVLVAQGIVDALALDVGVSGPMSPFAAGALVTSTVAAGAGAAVVYAGLVRFTDRPVRNFIAAAGVVFAVMLIPVIAFAPSLGVTTVGQAVLAVHHALVAVPIVAALVGAVSR